MVNSFNTWDSLLVVKVAAVLDERPFFLREVGYAFLLRGNQLFFGALNTLTQHFF